MTKTEMEIRTEMEQVGIGKATFEYMMAEAEHPDMILMYAVYEHRKIDPSKYNKGESQ